MVESRNGVESCDNISFDCFSLNAAYVDNKRKK